MLITAEQAAGYEAYVLRGAAAFLRRVKPALSIDIHADPDQTDGRTTERAVRALLAPLGYQMEMSGHALLCQSQRGKTGFFR